jgi:hypothetical protein
MPGTISGFGTVLARCLNFQAVAPRVFKEVSESSLLYSVIHIAPQYVVV